MGSGAERAVRDAGMAEQAAIVGQGGAYDARRRIAAGGAFRASIAFFPDSYGENVLSLATKILEGEKVALMAYPNHVVLTADNLQEYYPMPQARHSAENSMFE